ncbi:MAG: WYL domain-containing protein [Bacteroidetes bacterium]|nr:MAG: WYL domain-containing protein [Bacteroidota bacterium]
MSINKLALIRYKTIDECLKNRFRKWTLEDLIEKVSEAIYEYEGIDTGVSKRTIQADLQIMRSDKLGYNAPIVVLERKFYTYEDAKYSITNAPINHADIQKIKEVVDILKQFSEFSYFEEMTEVVAKLENNLNKSAKKSQNYIQFEGNKRLKGIEHLNTLYQFILNKKTLSIEYQSFKAAQSQENIYYPYLLKEYRNRWFLIAKSKKNKNLVTMALDRIIAFREVEEIFLPHENMDFDAYYADVLGVTKTEKAKACQVVFLVDNANAPYVLTKPLHHSQVVLKQEKKGIIFKIEVVLNFELEREILGFGENLTVLSPKILVKKIENRLKKAKEKYVKFTENQ